MDRKSLLEAKRAKLEDLKKQRIKREREFRKELALDKQDDISLNPLVDSIVHDVLKGSDSIKEQKPIITEEKHVAVKSESIKTQTVVEHPKQMCTKAVDAEAISSEQLEEEDRQRKSIAKMKSAIEEKITTKYRQLLEERVKELEIKQKADLQKEHQRMFEMFSLPEKVEDENRERKSIYAKALSLESSYGELEKGKFTVSPPSFVSKVCTLTSSVCESRAVVWMDISSQHSNLVLCVYSHIEQTATCPRSIIIVWNLDTHKPEFTLFSTAELCIAKFMKSSSNSVIGGGKDGRLYMWKFDYPSRYPFSASKFPQFEHGTSPIINIHETSNTVVSVSVEGLVTVYSLDLMNRISEEPMTLDFKGPCLATAAEITLFQVIIGLYDGSIYSKSLSGNRQASCIRKAPQNTHLPITSLEEEHGRILAGSIDYRLRLLGDRTGNKEFRVPYAVCDACFTSNEKDEIPNKFVCASPTGKLDFWDLEEVASDPIQHIEIRNGDTLNRIIWHKQRRVILCGGLKGKIYMMQL